MIVNSDDNELDILFRYAYVINDKLLKKELNYIFSILYPKPSGTGLFD